MKATLPSTHGFLENPENTRWCLYCGRAKHVHYESTLCRQCGHEVSVASGCCSQCGTCLTSEVGVSSSP